VNEEDIQEIKNAVDEVRKVLAYVNDSNRFAKQAMAVVVDLCKEGFTRDEAVGILKAAIISKRR